MMTQDIINQLQVVECEIIQVIDSICRAHNLTYFAIGGSALGAVRHQGFIPWDDDIDIGMPRKDYEAFLKYAQQELPKEYFLQSFATEKTCPFYFSKVRKNNTRFVEYYLRDVDMHQGIFIDIFPFDNVPDNAILRKVHFNVCRFFHHLYLSKSLTTVCSSQLTRKENYKGVIRKILHVLLLPVPKRWLFHLLDRTVQMFNGRECKEISHIVRRRLRVYLKDLYPITYLPFEHLQMPVPHDYHAYLSAQFGNYSVIPPEHKRFSHLPYEVQFDTQEAGK